MTVIPRAASSSKIARPASPLPSSITSTRPKPDSLRDVARSRRPDSGFHAGISTAREAMPFAEMEEPLNMNEKQDYRKTPASTRDRGTRFPEQRVFGVGVRPHREQAGIVLFGTAFIAAGRKAACHVELRHGNRLRIDQRSLAGLAQHVLKFD